MQFSQIVARQACVISTYLAWYRQSFLKVKQSLSLFYKQFILWNIVGSFVATLTQPRTWDSLCLVPRWWRLQALRVLRARRHHHRDERQRGLHDHRLRRPVGHGVSWERRQNRVWNYQGEQRYVHHHPHSLASALKLDSTLNWSIGERWKLSSLSIKRYRIMNEAAILGTFWVNAHCSFPLSPDQG